MAVITHHAVDVPGSAGSIRSLVVRPAHAAGRLPALLIWSDIFQLTPSHVRVIERLAGHGFVVIAPEIYGRFEPSGTVLDFDADRQRALDDASKMEISWVDDDRRAMIEYTLSRDDVDPARLGAVGFCFGGHLAFRAALEPEIVATTCFYATGVHSGDLGTSKGTADTLSRVREIQGRLLLIWGAADPHIPAAGRRAIHHALEEAGVRYEFRMYDAEHAFVRDLGPRYEPEAADRAIAETIAFFRRSL